MEDIIYIKNENLSNYIMFKLDKIDNGFTIQELDQITEVVIDYNDENESSFIFLEELRKLKFLKRITLRNGYIYNDNYDIFLSLHNLNEFEFDNCEFENADLIASLKLKSLSLINCKIINYSFINLFELLEELTLINSSIEIDKINMLKKLKYLQLSYSTITGNNTLNIEQLEELYIDNTNINNFEFLNNLKNLQRVSIDENQYNDNKILFNDLMKKNVLVYYENMIRFGDE